MAYIIILLKRKMDSMKKKILIILNYYIPYISGVTEYARLAAEMLAKEGHEVIVLTSNHANLKEYEEINGVHVYRAKVLFKISKGTVSLQYITLARKLAKQADVVNLHCPMLESGLISLLIPKEKIVTMYHCDVNLPKSFVNNFIVNVMDLLHKICLKRSRSITVTSVDYAQHSRVAGKYKDKLIGITAPVKEYFPQQVQKSDKKIIGFCGRIVEEKGIDVLLKAYEIIKKERSEVELQIAGDYKSVAGGSIYPSLKEYIEKNHIEDVKFLGKLPEKNMAEFFSSLDVFVLPSINSLEAYGMVQIEAMRCGAPVVASDLYGVRTIVQTTGGGLISKRNDYKDLAECIKQVLDNKEKYSRTIEEIEKNYSNKLWEEKYKKVLLGQTK